MKKEIIDRLEKRLEQAENQILRLTTALNSQNEISKQNKKDIMFLVHELNELGHGEENSRD
jgi:ferritin-like metal-binding protein YciE